MTTHGGPRYNYEMKRSSAKKTTDRRKKPRKKTSSARTRSAAPVKKIKQEYCQNCAKALRETDRILFVEEEIGRIFCSETCIAAFFTPEIERLEKEYYRRLSSTDLSGPERENLAHLRWITLQEPDEIWQEKTPTGDYRFTLISEFQPGNKRIWCVCICLFLRNEPSFLYLAFPTRNAAMLHHYRKGDQVQLKQQNPTLPSHSLSSSDGLADHWTEDETFRAQLRQERSHNDIPVDEYEQYQSCVEETLENPDEVWSLVLEHKKGQNSLRLYHFIRSYPNKKPCVWYIIVAREIDDEEQIEILDTFPTRDASLVDHYRKGQQEVGALETHGTSSKVVH